MDIELRMQQQLMMIEQRLAEAQQKIVTMMEEKIAKDTPEPSQVPAHKSFKCTVCEKSFEHSGKLHRHMRIHTGERPHECQVCGKNFIQSGQLVIHMRLHTGDRPYSCQHCDKAFTCSKQLKVHLRTHTKEKPYKCEICGKCFGYNHVLKLHQVAHFGEKIYKCTICDSTFNKKKHLEAHIRGHEEPTHAQMLTSIESLTPPPASPAPVSVPTERRFLLPSIDSLPSTVYNREWRPEDFDQTSPQDLSRKPQSLKARSRGSAIRRNPLYPVTPSLVKNLLAEDLAMFGPPSPLTNSSSLNLLPSVSRIGDLMVAPLTPPPSVSPVPLAPSPSLSSMSEQSLPPRKRRYAFSECSETDTDSRPSPSASPMSDRSSVICFGLRH